MEIKEIYLSNLEWTKTHDNMGGVMGNVVFKDNISYEEYNKLFKYGYFILCDKDYITNLQEERNNMACLVNELQEDKEDLQEEKIQLEGKIKQLEHNCQQASDSCRQHRLASKNRIRRLKRREKQINLYKSRNKKAIEYLKDNACYSEGEFCDDLDYCYCKDLLNILQGEDKE